jgi:stearoyl-CoA desaturase (delta-9 desaturase)
MGSTAHSWEKKTEIFSPKLFTIILAVHILAIPALLDITTFNIFAWLTFHFFFGTLGASIGLHRYCSHRSFEFTNIYFKALIGLVATLCFQGGPIFWATAHREHHRYSEKIGDPHDARRGFFWSHVGWMFFTNPNGFSYIKSLRITSDLKKDKIMNFFEIHSISINVFFLIFLFIFCYLTGSTSLFFWIGPLRIVSVWHCTWLINSYSHGAKFTGKLENTKIKDSILMAFLIGGDGDHAFHHQDPSSIKHSKRDFHFDYGYILIETFKKLGLVKIKEKPKFYTNRFRKAE